MNYRIALFGLSILLLALLQACTSRLQAAAHPVVASAAPPLASTPAPAIPAASSPAIVLTPRERDLLVLNAYNEARGDPEIAIRAVLAVTMARVESACFPDTVSEVIYQPRQFSWTHIRGTARSLATARAREPEALERVEEIVDRYIADGAPAGENLLYHARSVRPVWAASRQLQRSGVIGSHVFYEHRLC
ncbi:cell wall hydrolase [Chitinilyticum litopenaei]|uniref:cell wall hydrolase n=1 Tax=Chitinilyticum litopenaei TaxID=1121276 RepID=UPI0005BBD4D9|nr:cell wall hydrolase [Chitinilyticum litopenaei]